MDFECSEYVGSLFSLLKLNEITFVDGKLKKFTHSFR